MRQQQRIVFYKHKCKTPQMRGEKKTKLDTQKQTWARLSRKGLFLWAFAHQTEVKGQVNPAVWHHAWACCCQLRFGMAVNDDQQGHATRPHASEGSAEDRPGAHLLLMENTWRPRQETSPEIESGLQVPTEVSGDLHWHCQDQRRISHSVLRALDC